MSEFLQFDLMMPRRIAFGWGRRAEIGALAASLGRRAFLIDGSKTLRASPIWEEMRSQLQKNHVHVEHVASAVREPTIPDVDETTARVRSLHPRPGDLVIGIGGGSAIDLAKAVAAMATNRPEKSARHFLEGIGTGAQIEADPLPVLAMPTTAGTGSEATRNAVIACDDPPCKKSLRSERMLPAVVLVDPELTISCPRQQTAWSGMDAITQLFESYISKRSQPITDAICQQALIPAVNCLVRACEDPQDRSAREALSAAALASGIALANSGLGMAHGVAAALGSICNVPHGLACAVMLPIALTANHGVSNGKLQRLGLERYGNRREDPSLESARFTPALFIEELLVTLGIPTRLRDLGVRREQVPALVTGSRGNSMNGNPRDLTDEELIAILEANW